MAIDTPHFLALIGLDFELFRFQRIAYPGCSGFNQMGLGRMSETIHRAIC